MIARPVFYERLEKHCKPCSEWNGACKRGHGAHSPTGCPLRKFEPVDAAGYDVDRGVPIGEGCSSCGKADPEAIPDISWAQVTKHFVESMIAWGKAGLPVVTDEEHTRRYALCQRCPQFKKFYCKLCKCVVYTKTKVATEKCPLGGW